MVCGRRVKTPELGFKLYQWDNIKSRVFGWMLVMQVRIIIKDIERYAEEEGVPVDVPAIDGTAWLSRWSREWGVCARAVTLVYKV